MAQPNPNEDNIPRDLIDQRQIELFDAFHRLSKLKIAGQVNIDVPQLVVVGSQSSGKSSTLEALVRFQFPVDTKLSTKFPIKLILRRSEHEAMHASIELQSQQTWQQTAEVLQVFEDINTCKSPSPEQLKELMLVAHKALGVKPPRDPALPDNANTPAIKTAKSITDDVLVIEQSGPNLPLLTLLDLPGLFVATSEEQDEVSREKVRQMVRQHILSKRAVVMVIASASEGFHNSNIISTIQDFIKEDAGLQDRAIGVITKPDSMESHQETLDLLNGKPGLLTLKHGWHVLRNQSSDERTKGHTRLDRDRRETEYFAAQPWQSLSHCAKGIVALRTILKNLLWTHTKRELPELISEVKAKIAGIQSQLDTANKSRATDWDRRQYLFGIAQKFERLTREAVQGTYEDEPCTELHPLGACNCRSFFPPLRDDRTESQVPRLRANVRALSKAFAIAMREYGKTQIILDTVSADKQKDAAVTTQSSTDTSTDHGADQQSGQSRNDPITSQKVLAKYYSHAKPENIGREDYLRIVAEDIERNRAQEPIGEASEALYRGLFHWQSKNWEAIATNHLRAVWKKTEEFINLVLNEVCKDQDVRYKLQERIVTPNLEKMQRSSYRTLKDLLSCRSQGGTGFHDGYFHIMDIHDIDENTQKLTERLNGFNFGGLELSESTRVGFVDLLKYTLGSLVASPVLGTSLDSVLVNFVVHTIEANLSKSDSNKLNGKERPSKATTASATMPTKATTSSTTMPTTTTKANADMIPMLKEMNGHKDSQERAADYVEAHYQIYMLSFVGYVNSLVIEVGILRKLANDIFSQNNVLQAKQEVVDDIVIERPGDIERRKENENNLQTLKEILVVLQKTDDEQ